MAVDPGGITGYVIWTDGERVENELKANEFVQFIADLVEQNKIDCIVCERFIVTSQTGKFSQANWSLEQIGVLKFLSARFHISFVLQNVSDAKRFASDERLNSVGWTKPKGAGHARDAQRHLLLYLVNQKLLDLKLLI